MAETTAVAGPVRLVHPVHVFLWVCILNVGCSFTWSPAFDEDVEPAQLQSVAIAPLAAALTFARYEKDGVLHLMLVERYENGIASGIDLSNAYASPLDSHMNDPISLFLQEGYEDIEALALTDISRVQVPIDLLTLPVDLRAHHIAAGTNYAKHGSEAGVEDGPYLFPKLVEPTPWNADVSVHKGLLDYEVELAYVPLSPIRENEVPEYMGLIVCSDYSDRDTLLRHLDVDDVTSGQGFTTGKSFPGYLPVGNLFVVPRDYRTFATAIELRLYVNLELRQRESVSAAIWDIDEILRQIWKHKDITWAHGGGEFSLFIEGNPVLQERVMILSGTPYGVVFNEVTTEQKGTGFFDWIFGGWDQTFADHAIEDYITDARAAGIYLLTGDRVDIHVQNMGVVRNEVIQ